MTGDLLQSGGDDPRPTSPRRSAKKRTKAAAGTDAAVPSAAEAATGDRGPLGDLLEIASRPLPDGTPQWFGEIWKVWLDLGIPPLCTPEIASDPIRANAYDRMRARINRRIARNRDDAEATVRAASRTRRGAFELDAVVNAPAWPETVRRTLALIDESGCSRVLDLGGGSGGVGLAIARLRPQVEVTVADCMPRMLTIGRRIAEAHGVRNVRFIEASVFDPMPADLGDFEVMVWNKVWMAAEQWRRRDSRDTIDDLDDPLVPRRMLEVAEIDQTLADAVRSWASSLAPGGRILTSERVPTKLGKLAWLRILANAGLAVDDEEAPPILAALRHDDELVPAWIARHGTWSPDPAKAIAEALRQAMVPDELRPVLAAIADGGASFLATHGRVRFDWVECPSADCPLKGLGVVKVQRGWMIASHSGGPMPWDPWHHSAVGGLLVETESPRVGRFLLLRASPDELLHHRSLGPMQRVEDCLAASYGCSSEDHFASGPERLRPTAGAGAGGGGT